METRTLRCITGDTLRNRIRNVREIQTVVKCCKKTMKKRRRKNLAIFVSRLSSILFTPLIYISPCSSPGAFYILNLADVFVANSIPQSVASDT